METEAFILNNNNFVLYNELIGTAMGTIFAPPYACLSIGYLEETKFHPLLQITFNPNLADTLMEFYYRYMDDEFLPWPNDAAFNIFKELLNGLHNRIKFTLEPVSHSSLLQGGCMIQKINVLDISEEKGKH